jgi:WD40 repeat protein
MLVLCSAPARGVRTAALSPDGQLAAVARAETVHLIDMASGRTTAHLQAGRDAVLSLAFSDDGQWLLGGSDSGDEGHTLWRWSLQPLDRQAKAFPAHYRSSALAVCGDRLLSGGGEDDGNWILWSLPGLERLQEGGRDQGEVLSLALDAQGWAVLRGHELEFWRQGERAWRIDDPPGSELSWSQDGSELLLAGPEKITSYRRADGKPGKTRRAQTLQQMARGKVRLVWQGGVLLAWSGKRRLWEQPASHSLSLLQAPAQSPYLAGAMGSRVSLWDRQGAVLWTVDLDAPPGRLALDPWGRWLGVVGNDCTFLRLGDGSLASQGPAQVGGTWMGQEVFGRLSLHPEFIPWEGPADHPWTPALCGDDQSSVLWTGGRSVRLGDGAIAACYEGFRGQYRHVELASDWVALSNDTWIGVYDRASGRLRSLSEAWGTAGSGVAYDRDGTKALRVGLNRVQAWDLVHSRLLEEWPTPEPLTAIAGRGPYYAGGLSGALYQLDEISW